MNYFIVSGHVWARIRHGDDETVISVQHTATAELDLREYQECFSVLLSWPCGGNVVILRYCKTFRRLSQRAAVLSQVAQANDVTVHERP